MATVVPSVSSEPAGPVISPTSQRPTLPPLEQRVVLNNVSWDTYERLIEEINNPGTRLLYDEGLLEIMSPREGHDRFKKLLGRLVETLTEELDMPCRSTGSTTWRRVAKKKGLEADDSYYLFNASKVRGKREVDLKIDPPPDLAIEVENTSSSLQQLGVYASLGVPEIWRFDGDTLTILAFQSNGEYTCQETSRFFPRAATVTIVEWMHKCDELDETDWIKQFRRWIRENLVQSR
jgi:Uma2 family endonuclease